mgnify:CR=1 FL=1|tara:strand:- start:306 stop:626 length:321 start_codon:yes stop_codon:yes gene_type:complete
MADKTSEDAGIGPHLTATDVLERFLEGIRVPVPAARLIAHLKGRCQYLEASAADWKRVADRLTSRMIDPPLVLTERAENIKAAVLRDIRSYFKRLVGRLYWRTGDE